MSSALPRLSDEQVEEFFAWIQPVAEKIEAEGRPAWCPDVDFIGVDLGDDEWSKT